MIDICKHEGDKVLLVEGKDDCHVILSLCKQMSLPADKFGIYECGGYEKTLKRLNSMIVGSANYNTIGVVVDADRPDIIDRWTQISQKIKAHNYLFPEEPDPRGTVLPLNYGKPIVGIWLMPNNREPGMLEDFLMEMADNGAILAARRCLELAIDSELTSFKSDHFSKALIHTYLAWQDAPGKPLGQSVTSHALKPDTETASIFLDWLKRLFDL